MNVHINYILAQEHIADLHRSAAQARRARDADRRRRHARRTRVRRPERLTRRSDPTVSPARP